MTKNQLVKDFPYFANVNFDRAFDELTDVFNRETVQGYINHLVSEQKPFSLFIADVDNFKYINDGYGHKTGDVVLANVAKFLMDTVGKRGIVGRFGGDEFLIVCEGITEYKEVWDIGHDINMSIGDLHFKGVDAPSITISMGVARYPLDTKNYDELWDLADKALYRGKMKGRNCFIIYLESKHKNLELKGKRDMAFSPMYLHAKVFSTLTETRNLASAIKNQLLFLVSYHMYDHMCIETETGMKFNIIHFLSKHKEFKPVKFDELPMLVNNYGLAYSNKISSYSSSMSEEFINNLVEQNIVSSLFCKIDAFDKEYGYIRVDMTDTVRIWQNDELNLIVSTAKAIGLLLYYNDATIENLDLGDVSIVGKE